MNATWKQIRSPATELSGARAREQEPETRRMAVDDGLNHVQQLRHLLHFIDQHGPDIGLGGVQLSFQSLRLREVVMLLGWEREIDTQIRVQRSQQGGLPHLPRTEEQGASLAMERGRQFAFEHVGKITA